MNTRHLFLISLFTSASLCLLAAPALELKPADAFFAKYEVVKAPVTTRLQLKPGDRLAICGDSITEQRLYSRLIEDYLIVTRPDLNLSVRQFGWGGERADGFLRRMTNDCLRFRPTIATTCYGMNDHEYRAYEDRIGRTYESNSLAIVRAFKANGVRVILGSPGCVGKIPWWQKGFTTEDLNLNLCHLRNLDVGIARQEKTGFADVFWPMLLAAHQAQQNYGTNYTLAGEDGIHPQWAGHTVMAFEFLKALGLDGNIGTFTVDLKRNKIKVTTGHELVSVKPGEFKIKSSRYPFCACQPSPAEAAGAKPLPVYGSDGLASFDSIRSGMAWVPFNQELNRLMLVVKHADSGSYRVSWGGESKTFTGEQLARGINLAAEFPVNPFTPAFIRVDAAVAAKQDYETRQMKQLFRPEGVKDPTMEQIRAQTELVFTATEKEHTALVAAVHAAMVPVTHTIKITPE